MDSRMEGMINGMLSRYDKNRDGVLTAEEESGSRMLSGADGNGDGKITKEEIQASFASRFGGGDRGRGSDGGSRGFGRLVSTSGEAGHKRRAMATDLGDRGLLMAGSDREGQSFLISSPTWITPA